MAIIKHKDKRTGVVYVYESESYWDKEKKQPRSKRTLIGKYDEETGEIIPTGKSGRKKSNATETDSGESQTVTEQLQLLEEKNEIIKNLKDEISALKKEKAEMLQVLQNLLERYQK